MQSAGHNHNGVVKLLYYRGTSDAGTTDEPENILNLFDVQGNVPVLRLGTLQQLPVQNDNRVKLEDARKEVARVKRLLHVMNPLR